MVLSCAYSEFSFWQLLGKLTLSFTWLREREKVKHFVAFVCVVRPKKINSIKSSQWKKWKEKEKEKEKAKTYALLVTIFKKSFEK